MAKAWPLALPLLFAACEKPPAEPPPEVLVTNGPKPEFIRQAGPAPVLLTYRPAIDGGPEAFRTAIVGGILDLERPCVSLLDSNGQSQTIVTGSGASLKRDSLGWFLPTGRDRLRHGASIEGGGGQLPALPSAETLSREVPEACRNGPAVELIGIHRHNPGDHPVEPAPPPPRRRAG